MPPTDPQDRDLAAVAAALLHQGERIDRLARLLTVAAVAGALLGAASGHRASLPLLAIAALLGLAELYLALRIGFDAALFGSLAEPGGLDTARLDTALLGLGLLPAGKAGRAIPERIAGARRLLAWQGGVTAAQTALLAGASAAAAWERGG